QSLRFRDVLVTSAHASSAATKRASKHFGFGRCVEEFCRGQGAVLGASRMTVCHLPLSMTFEQHAIADPPSHARGRRAHPRDRARRLRQIRAAHWARAAADGGRLCGAHLHRSNKNGVKSKEKQQPEKSKGEPCFSCRGEGHIWDHVCPSCTGTGRSIVTRRRHISWKPNMLATAIRVLQMAQAGRLRCAPVHTEVNVRTQDLRNNNARTRNATPGAHQERCVHL